MNCSICTAPATPFAKGRILDKYDVMYLRCGSCGFIRTETPYWLPEAYAEAINLSDVGLVSRNIMMATLTKSLILSFFDGNGRFVDYGGGYGLFVRLMRDEGFDFYRFDKHCMNLFAHELDADLTGDASFELLTAFEVFEHLPDPLEESRMLMSHASNILLTTEILPPENPVPEQWWYYGLDHGQHVSFFTVKALTALAERLGMNLYTDGRLVHLLTRKKLPAFLFTLLTRQKVARLVNRIVHRESLIQLDYQNALARSKRRRAQ